jgi:MoxR-like ATPase
MQTAVNIEELKARIYQESEFVTKLQTEISKQVVGQKEVVSRLLMGLLSNGHILLEGVPGLAKTLTVSTLAKAIDLKFHRIQFTPDLLPADLIGTMIYNPTSGQFQVRRGPIFANFILADEINRAPAKVQSALLEAMQEKQITLGDSTYKLDEPFLVLATQNPLEQEGTYPLPEAQQDRFLLKVLVHYPTRNEELQIMRENVFGLEKIQISPVMDTWEILQSRNLCRQVYMDAKIEQYILDLVFATRSPKNAGLGHLTPLISYGGSPRASISLAMAARAMAMLQQRAFVTPDDVKTIAPDVLRHRIGLTYEAEAEEKTVETIIREILGKIVAP